MIRLKTTPSRSPLALLWIGGLVAAVMASVNAHGTELVLDTQVLFTSGQGGYHTYRIPAMAQTPDGTLFAFAEARKNSAGDSGDIDLVMRRSTDLGVTWSPMELLMDDGNNTMGQPTPIVDPSNGALHLMFSRNNREMFVARFDSETGKFGEPTDITAVAKSLEVPFDILRMGAGPTAGLQGADGRLLAPVWVNETIGDANEYRAGVLYSDDGGTTWQAGGVPAVTAQIAGINESTVAKLPNGDLYMTQRTNAGTPKRSFSTSSDNGITWSEAKLVPQIDADMTTIKAGLASIEAKGSSNVSGLVLSAPEGPGRAKLALWYSPDGQQWSRVASINNQHAGYSELIQLNEGIVGLLYENGANNYHQQLTFTRLTINADTVVAFNGVDGDINQDGVLTLEDVSLFIERFDGLATYSGQLESYMHGDLNFDGRSDLHDVALFRHYLSEAGLEPSLLQLSQLTTIPEPATAWLSIVSISLFRYWQVTSFAAVIP